MALRIVAAAEPIVVETVCVTIYGPPGVGKTSLAFSAEAPLLLNADAGAHRSAFRQDTATANSWSDIAGITAEDVKPYKTLVLDTAGRALDLLTTDIIAGNPKMGRGGALTLQGYGELKSRFAAYLTLMRSFGLDIVLVAHSDEKQQGDDIIERIDMQGSSKNEVYKSADAMARLGIIDGVRVLSFSPTDTRFGKDPVQIGAIKVPDLSDDPHFLAGLIARIKDGLNSQSEAQRKATADLTEWKAALAMCKTAEDYNGMIPLAESKQQKRTLLNTAEAAGFTFDRDAGVFVDPSPVPA